MQNIGVFYGGRSCEHDISIITAVQAMKSLDKRKYNIIPIYIDKNGVFNTGRNLGDMEVYNKPMRLKKVHFEPQCPVLFCGRKKLARLDAALLCTHGVSVEDGALQGYLETINIPYTSCGVLASGVGMDKIIMKKVFASFNLPVLPFLWINEENYEKNRDKFIKEVEKKLRYPVIIKPSNLGSSIGIAKAKDRTALIEAIEVALSYDSRILVERAVTEITEINCSAMKKEGQVLTSVLEQPVAWENFLSFEEKYIKGGGKKGGMANLKRKLPADIADEAGEKIKDYTERIYNFLDCAGVVRVDYIIDRTDDKIYVNEINTIPGSLSYYLWEFGGVMFRDLLNIILNEAVEKWNNKELLTYSYKSDVLKGGESVSKLGKK